MGVRSVRVFQTRAHTHAKVGGTPLSTSALQNFAHQHDDVIRCIIYYIDRLSNWSSSNVCVCVRVARAYYERERAHGSRFDVFFLLGNGRPAKW